MKSELKILGCETALDSKKLGYKIKMRKNHEDWNNLAKERCKEGIEAKFAQKQALTPFPIKHKGSNSDGEWI